MIADLTLEPIDRRTWQLCWVIVLGAFASGLDASIVNVGLESMNRDLQSTLSTTQWVVSGYILALAVSLPVSGWLGRRLGSGTVWLWALTCFTAASVACALAPNVQLLIVARVIQGFAGGVLIPTGQTILGQAVGPGRLGRVMGVLGIAVSAAPAIGSVLGGALLHSMPWPVLFAINVPIGVVGIALGYRLVPRGERGADSPLHRTGLTLISIGLPALVYSTTRWGDTGALSADSVIAGVIAVAALAAFVVTSRTTQHPLMDLGLLGIRAFRAGAVTALFSGALVFGSGVVLALYFQLERGLDPLQTGISLIGVAAATAAAAPVTGRWIDRHGTGAPAVAGGILATATTFTLIVLPTDISSFVVQPVLVAFGVSVSLVAMPAGVTAYKAVTASQLPDAITQINIFQRIGGALGGALCAVLIAGGKGFGPAFTALLLSALGAGVGALLILRSTVSATRIA